MLLQINLPQSGFEPRFCLSLHKTGEEETPVTSHPLSVGKGSRASVKCIHNLDNLALRIPIDAAGLNPIITLNRLLDRMVVVFSLSCPWSVWLNGSKPKDKVDFLPRTF